MGKDLRTSETDDMSLGVLRGCVKGEGEGQSSHGCQPELGVMERGREGPSEGLQSPGRGLKPGGRYKQTVLVAPS